MEFDEIKTASLLLMHWSPNVHPPTKGIHTIRTKNSLSMRSVCKKLHHVRKEKVFIHDTQTWGRTNIYLYFPAPHFSSLSHPNDHDQFQWFDEFSLNTFSLNFLFHSFDDSYGITLKFLHMLRGEVFIQGSQNKHWYPHNSDANQVC